jgi:hypothetical protein
MSATAEAITARHHAPAVANERFLGAALLATLGASPADVIPSRVAYMRHPNFGSAGLVAGHERLQMSACVAPIHAATASREIPMIAVTLSARRPGERMIIKLSAHAAGPTARPIAPVNANTIGRRERRCSNHRRCGSDEGSGLTSSDPSWPRV